MHIDMLHIPTELQLFVYFTLDLLSQFDLRSSALISQAELCLIYPRLLLEELTYFHTDGGGEGKPFKHLLTCALNHNRPVLCLQHLSDL